MNANRAEQSSNPNRVHLLLAADMRSPKLARTAIDSLTRDLRPLQRFDARVLASDLVSHALTGASEPTDALTVTADLTGRFRVEVASPWTIPPPPVPLVALLDSVASEWTSDPTHLSAEMPIRGAPRLQHVRHDELVSRLRSGDDTARRQLVLRHLGLGVAIARSFEGRGVDLDDLIAVAELGLVRASLRFDPDRGTEFSTFAGHVVTGELRQYFRDQAWAIGMPRSLRERARAVRVAREQLQHHAGRAPTDREIADRLDLDVTQVREAATAGLSFIAAPFEPDVRRPAVGIGYADPGLTHGAERADLERALGCLDPEDRQILHRYFVRDQTQAEIAEHLDTTQVQISRRIARNLRRLRGELVPPPANA